MTGLGSGDESQVISATGPTPPKDWQRETIGVRPSLEPQGAVVAKSTRGEAWSMTASTQNGSLMVCLFVPSLANTGCVSGESPIAGDQMIGLVGSVSGDHPYVFGALLSGAEWGQATRSGDRTEREMIKLNAVIAEQTAAIITVTVGWIVVFDQARHNDNSGNGTAWLLGFALVATAGAAVTLMARQRQRALRGLGLLIAVASPTVFAYPLNIALALIACAEFAVAAMGIRRATGIRARG
jgi:cytochrome bd-type quinol oxidase subunit 2